MANINEKIFKAKYAISDDETFEMMCDRVSDNEEQSVAMKQLKIMPAGRHLTAKVKKSKSEFWSESSKSRVGEKTLFNCYVLGQKNVDGKGIDSRESISNHEMRSDNISSRGGGIGTNWTALRPRDADIGQNDGGSSGAVSFLKRYAYGQSIITQGGNRRGALMASMMVYHPDIEEFIDCKQDISKLSNVNISVMVDDAFMEAVKNDDEISLFYPDYKNHKERYNDEWDGNLFETKLPCKTYKTVKAKSLWNKIQGNAWKTGEPGVLFYDNMNKASNYGHVDKIISTNPCAEQPLPSDLSCVLGSINLLAHLTDSKKHVNLPELDNSIRLLVDYLDKSIDLELYTDKYIEEKQKMYRQIGVGVMGFADLLIMKGLKYGSEKSMEYTEHLAQFILDRGYYWSAMRAKKYGKAPIWKKYKMNEHYLNLCSTETQKAIRKYGLRNSAVISIAPTGSIAMLCGVNGGIEPYFAFEYIRDDVLGKRSIKADIIEHAPDESALVTAQHISPKNHIKMQAIWQKYTDASISKCLSAKDTMVIINDKVVYLDELFIGEIESDMFYDVRENLVTKNHLKENVNIKSLYNNGGKDVIKITFNDGSTLIGTYNHKIWIDGVRWEKLINVNVGDVINI